MIDNLKVELSYEVSIVKRSDNSWRRALILAHSITEARQKAEADCAVDEYVSCVSRRNSCGWGR